MIGFDANKIKIFDDRNERFFDFVVNCFG